MCIRVSWDLMNSCFFETPYTKFMLQNADKAILIEEPRAVPGTSMFITKVIMPMQRDDGTNEWGLTDASKAPAVKDDDAEDEIGDEEDSVSYGESEEAAAEDAGFEDGES